MMTHLDSFFVPIRRAARGLAIFAAVAIAASIVSAPTPAFAGDEVRSAVTGKASLLDVDANRVLRQNSTITVLASATRAESATAVTSSDITNYSASCVRVYLNISGEVGTCSLTSFKLQAKDPVSGSYIDIPGATIATQTATGLDQLIVCPGIAETANESVSDHMPFTWRTSMVVGTGGAGAGSSFTVSIGADLYQ